MNNLSPGMSSLRIVLAYLTSTGIKDFPDPRWKIVVFPVCPEPIKIRADGFLRSDFICGTIIFSKDCVGNEPPAYHHGLDDSNTDFISDSDISII